MRTACKNAPGNKAIAKVVEFNSQSARNRLAKRMLSGKRRFPVLHRRQVPSRTSAAPISTSTPASKLLQSCLHSVPEAWSEFVRRFQPLIASVITRTLRRCTRPVPAMIDDLVQETYLKLCADNFKALRKFECRHEHALTGFLKVIASNVAQDHLRSSLSQKRGSGKGEEDIEHATMNTDCLVNAVSMVEQHVILGQIQSCLEKGCSETNLQRDCRIFSLYYRQGLTAEEISRSDGISLSVKGVESALLRLTNLLRSKLNGSGLASSRPKRFVTSIKAG